jgi:hypothetical protein
LNTINSGLIPLTLDAREVTDKSIPSLAALCPKLRKFTLQNSDTSTPTFLSLLSHCPLLTHLELGIITEEAWKELLEHTEWVPKLKKLRLAKVPASTVKQEREWMMPMREVGKQREKLVIDIVQRWEEKNYDDWEVREMADKYKKGKKVPDRG